jgi:heptosyltransferase-3
METVLDRLPPGARVAIVRLRSLGDSVLTTPAIHILKAFRPDLEIAVVSETRFAAVYERNPDVSVVVDPSMRSLRGFGPELCLNLHGGARSARLTALSGARHRAGFAHFPHPYVYNVPIPRTQEILGIERPVHTAEHLASAMFFLGAPVSAISRARLFVERAEKADEPYAVIHPFASEPEKTWPAPFFLEVAQRLKREFDLDPVFLSGPGEDLSPFQMRRTAANPLLARTKQLMAGASLFVGNDSGPAHIAAAFGVPVVVLFGPSDPVTWAPWRTHAEVLISDGPIHTISPQQVISALEKLRVHA